MAAAAASAVYSPRLWPAIYAGWITSLSSDQIAMLTVKSAGWVFAVNCNSSAGPSKHSLLNGSFNARSASSKTPRARG